MAPTLYRRGGVAIVHETPAMARARRVRDFERKHANSPV
jgi:hypothetical protein